MNWFKRESSWGEKHGSPTLSDQAALECPSLKMGPGLSTRSHSANEFIFVHEIEEAVKIYIELSKNTLIMKLWEKNQPPTKK